MNGWKDGWTGEWLVGRMDGLVNGWLVEKRVHP